LLLMTAEAGDHDGLGESDQNGENAAQETGRAPAPQAASVPQVVNFFASIPGSTTNAKEAAACLLHSGRQSKRGREVKWATSPLSDFEVAPQVTNYSALKPGWSKNCFAVQPFRSKRNGFPGFNTCGSCGPPKNPRENAAWESFLQHPMLRALRGSRADLRHLMKQLGVLQKVKVLGRTAQHLTKMANGMVEDVRKMIGMLSDANKLFNKGQPTHVFPDDKTGCVACPAGTVPEGYALTPDSEGRLQFCPALRRDESNICAVTDCAVATGKRHKNCCSKKAPVQRTVASHRREYKLNFRYTSECYLGSKSKIHERAKHLRDFSERLRSFSSHINGTSSRADTLQDLLQLFQHADSKKGGGGSGTTPAPVGWFRSWKKKLLIKPSHFSRGSDGHAWSQKVLPGAVQCKSVFVANQEHAARLEHAGRTGRAATVSFYIKERLIAQEFSPRVNCAPTSTISSFGTVAYPSVCMAAQMSKSRMVVGRTPTDVEFSKSQRDMYKPDPRSESRWAVKAGDLVVANIVCSVWKHVFCVTVGKSRKCASTKVVKLAYIDTCAQRTPGFSVGGYTKCAGCYTAYDMKRMNSHSKRVRELSGQGLTNELKKIQDRHKKKMKKDDAFRAKGLRRTSFRTRVRNSAKKLRWLCKKHPDKCAAHTASMCKGALKGHSMCNTVESLGQAGDSPPIKACPAECQRSCMSMPQGYRHGQNLYVASKAKKEIVSYESVFGPATVVATKASDPVLSGYNLRWKTARNDGQIFDFGKSLMLYDQRMPGLCNRDAMQK